MRKKGSTLVEVLVGVAVFVLAVSFVTTSVYVSKEKSIRQFQTLNGTNISYNVSSFYQKYDTSWPTNFIQFYYEDLTEEEAEAYIHVASYVKDDTGMDTDIPYSYVIGFDDSFRPVTKNYNYSMTYYYPEMSTSEKSICRLSFYTLTSGKCFLANVDVTRTVEGV